MNKKATVESVQQVVDQKAPFVRMGQIHQANRILRDMGSPTRIGNIFNPALRQSVWDTSNLPED